MGGACGLTSPAAIQTDTLKTRTKAVRDLLGIQGVVGLLCAFIVQNSITFSIQIHHVGMKTHPVVAADTSLPVEGSILLCVKTHQNQPKSAKISRENQSEIAPAASALAAPECRASSQPSPPW